MIANKTGEVVKEGERQKNQEKKVEQTGKCKVQSAKCKWQMANGKWQITKLASLCSVIFCFSPYKNRKNFNSSQQS